MKLKPQIIFSILVLIFFAYLAYEAREWRPQARLYPWAVGIPMLGLAFAHLIWELLKGQGGKEPPQVALADFQFTETGDISLARRRTVNIFSWIFGFFATIWLLGFSIAVPALAFLYLKVQSREGWGLSILFTAAAWLFFWGLFIRLLNLPFPEGQVWIWLGLV